MTDPAAPPYSRPSSAAAYANQTSIPPPSPRPSVTSRGSRSSLRRQAAIAAGSASASASPQQHQPIIPEPSAEPFPPKFTPLFTTVTSTAHPSNKSTTHHPTVHYVFADDDPDILTEALARHHRAADAEEEPDDRPAEERGPAERAVVLDIVPSEAAPAGYEVVWASSLAPDWAVVDAGLTRMNASGGGLREGGGTMMLRIEGVSVEGSGPTVPSTTSGGKGGEEGGRRRGAGGKKGEEKAPSEEYAELVEEFEMRMDVLRRVVEAAELRRGDVLVGGDEDRGDGDEGETQRHTGEYGGNAGGKGKERADSLEDEEDEAGGMTG